MPRNVFLSMTLAARRLDWITVFRILRCLSLGLGVLVFVAGVVGAVFTAMDLLGINF
jgi:hypothetical protein